LGVVKRVPDDGARKFIMQAISRRQFLGTTAAGIGTAGYFAGAARKLAATPLNLPIGCQVFPVREQLVQDFDGTLREIAAVGYRVIEFCSPPGFVDMGFAPLTGMKAPEIRQKITGAGLQVVSCHYQFRELKEHLDERISFAGELGVKHMVVATLAIPESAPMDEWRKGADELNKLGARTREAGIQLGFHNHTFEFKKIGGMLIFDELMNRCDPTLVKSQFQVKDAVGLGFDPVTYLTKYPGRFLSLHLADWLAGENKEEPVGQGSIDWKRIFTAAKVGGVEYYFVEMSMDALKVSYPYLRDLRV
jgi:sugar phosphate isomerase/epimerase